jgi:trigger factor
MSAGEEKELNVTFPAEYHARDLAGKPVVFKVKVHEVKVKELPELDDEFAKDVSENFKHLEELKADTRKNLEKGREAAAENLFREALMQKAIDNMEVEIPRVHAGGAGGSDDPGVQHEYAAVWHDPGAVCADDGLWI